MEARQHLVMQEPTRLTVPNLALDKPASLDRDEPSRELRARPGLDDPLPSRAREPDLFLRVEGAIDLPSEQQQTRARSGGPQRDGPARPAVKLRIEREARRACNV